MLHIHSSFLSNDSKAYLISVLMNPEQVIKLVEDNFYKHLKEFESLDQNKDSEVSIYSAFDLISSDIRLVFELNRSLVSLFSDERRPYWSDEVLKSFEERVNSAIKRLGLKDRV